MIKTLMSGAAVLKWLTMLLPLKLIACILMHDAHLPELAGAAQLQVLRKKQNARRVGRALFYKLASQEN
jgi:hypothetical protein